MSWASMLNERKAKYAERKRIEHEEHERALRTSRFETSFNFEQVEHIALLAFEGIVPDGTYSDDECALWSALRREFHHWK